MPLLASCLEWFPTSQLSQTKVSIPGQRAIGKIRLKCQRWDLKTEVTSYVIDTSPAWIHSVLPSTLHQCFKYVDEKVDKAKVKAWTLGNRSFILFLNGNWHSYPPMKGGILSPTRLPIQITILTKRLDCFLSISCLFFFYICFLRTQWTIRCGITCWLRCACLGWFRISLSCSWASCSCSSGISCSWHKISRRSCLLLLRNF